MLFSMKNKGVKKRTRTHVPNQGVSDNVRSFKALFPVIRSPEGIKPALLKNLHGLLVLLSSELKWTDKYEFGPHDFHLEMCHDGIQVTFGDICELSNVLFKELEEKFEQCFSIMCDISDSKDSSRFVLYDTVEVVNFLLRCCMVLLTLLIDEINIILEKGKILLRILRKLNLLTSADKNGKCAFVFEKSAFNKSPIADNGFNTSCAENFTASLHFLEPYNPLLYFKSTILEVFVDELLVNESLRGCFQKIDFAAPINDRQFYPQSTQGDIAIVVELICNHFILTFSDKQGFEDFLNRLFCLHAKQLTYPFRAPALQVTAAIYLLLSPIMISAPKYVQAHMVSLVSEAMDSVMNSKSLKPDHKLINGFLSTFEKSVNLYTEHMSCFQIITCPTRAKIAYPLFDSYISDDMKNKINNLINELDHSSNPNFSDSFSEMKSDLVSSSMRFVKECQHVYDESYQDEIMNILSCLILKASERFDDTAIRPIEAASLQHIFLLASLLKLMSISLLQAIWCLRHSDDLCCLKTLKGFSCCKEYDFILGVIRFFRDLNFSLPLQQVLSEAMSSYSTRHVDSKTMFLHFSGLMSLSFASGLDCLVKGCLLAIMALLNLFVLEEGDLDALHTMVTSHSESFSASSAIVKFREAVVGQNSALVVASKFQKIRSRHRSVLDNKCEEMETSPSISGMEPALALEEETEETSNGEIFFKCMMKMDQKPSDFDDLIDFIECKEPNRFSAWFENRQRYRKKKLEKMAVLRWKRKKKFWKTVKG